MSFLSNKSKGVIQLIIVICFVVFSFAVSGLLQSKKPTSQTRDNQDRAIFVETEIVSAAQHQVQFKTTGVIESLTDIDIVPQVSGQVIKINEQFFEGGRFEKDEILFEIEPRDFELEVERLQSEIARAQTTLTLEKAEGLAAIAEWKQFNGDKTPPDLVARKPQMAEARANLRAAKAQLANAKLDLERTKISMPFNGQVLSSTVAKGRFVSEGQSVAQVFDLDSLEVRSSLSGQQLDWLVNEEDSKISITTNHLGQKKTYDGVLKRNSSALDPATRFATVSFGFENTADLLPGVFANIIVKGPKLDNVFKIPAIAIQKGSVIWSLDQEDRLVQIEPNIIYASDSYVIVSGLNGTLRVVTSRLDGGAEGMKVQIADDDTGELK